MSNKPFEEGPYATPEEVSDALRRLSNAEWLRLRKAARVYAPSIPYSTPEELLRDTMTTAYLAAAGSQGRRWKLSVPFGAYLVMSMRGMASDARRSASRTYVLREIFQGDADEDSALLRSLELHAPSIEQTVLATEKEKEAGGALEQLREHFQADPAISRLLELAAAGLPLNKIQQELAMTPTQYASMRRRLRRGIESLSPGGRGRRKA
jgi:hypothetical protein